MSGPRLNVRILGCGSSGGVPRVGNDWGACDPSDPRNVRTRCSILLRYSDGRSTAWTTVLIDTSPDLRQQLLAARLDRLDAVVMSHHHADQCHGIDDVRPLALSQRAPLPVYMDSSTYGILGERFGYCFTGHKGYPPILVAHPTLQPERSFQVVGGGGALSILCLDQDHGTCRSLGFRIGPFAYCNDVVDLPRRSLELLDGVKVFVVDALRYTRHPTHANVDQALAWADRIGAERVILTNMHVDLDYHELDSKTPGNVSPAHDGMEMSLDHYSW